MSDETVIPAEAPEVQPAPETPAPAPETPADGAQPETPAPVAPEAAAPPKRSPVAVLQGRVGYLTKVNNQTVAERDALRQQNETLTALLNRGQSPEGAAAPESQHAPPAPRQVTPGTPEFQEAVRQEAANQAFQAEADRVWTDGKQKLGAAWDESLSALGAMGVLQRDFVEAAFATGDPITVLSSLGDDLEEAQRIASLPPIRMAIELTKLSNGRTAKPATAAPPLVSAAPPPIRPVSGAVSPTVDIYDPRITSGDHVSDDFLKARAKEGNPYYARYK